MSDEINLIAIMFRFVVQSLGLALILYLNDHLKSNDPVGIFFYYKVFNTISLIQIILSLLYALILFIYDDLFYSCAV